MDIYAKGKTIPSYAFENLFIQGEKLADTIDIYIDRVYCGKDLSRCSFLIRGVNENGDEAQQVLVPEEKEDKLLLKWTVSENFTAVSGKLFLELRASEISGDAETLIVKYEISEVNIAPSPHGENIPLPDVTGQAVSEISKAAAEGAEKIQSVIDSFDISAVENRLEGLEEKTAGILARPEVVPVTEAEYRAIPHKRNVLYVIVKE